MPQPTSGSGYGPHLRGLGNPSEQLTVRHRLSVVEPQAQVSERDHWQHHGQEDDATTVELGLQHITSPAQSVPHGDRNADPPRTPAASTGTCSRCPPPLPDRTTPRLRQRPRRFAAGHGRNRYPMPWSGSASQRRHRHVSSSWRHRENDRRQPAGNLAESPLAARWPTPTAGAATATIVVFKSFGGEPPATLLLDPGRTFRRLGDRHRSVAECRTDPATPDRAGQQLLARLNPAGARGESARERLPAPRSERPASRRPDARDTGRTAAGPRR